MNPPPLLLLATLLFWGWHSGLLVVGAVLGVILESPRLIKARWDLADEDFKRIWSFSIMLILTLGVYLFSVDENGGLGSLIHLTASVNNANAATLSIARAGSVSMRWLPMTLFLLIAAQQFSTRGKLTLSVISWVFRRRLKKGLGETSVNIAYPYFIVCLFSAGMHPNTGAQSYFWGVAVLSGWALWPLRSPRYRLTIWLAMLVATLLTGFGGQLGLGLTQKMLEGGTARWLQWMFQPKSNPLQTETSIGQIGRLKLSGAIVIRLTPLPGSPAPEYLREASYRGYRAQHWYAAPQGNTFELVSEGPTGSWRLVSGLTNTAGASLAVYLTGWNKDLSFPQGLLPLPSGSSLLENYNAVQVQKNAFGATMATGPGLALFNARFGPGLTMDSPPDDSTNHYDLIVQTNELPALKQVLAEMNIPGNADATQKLHAVQGFFANKFSYTTWLGPGKKPLGTNETPLARFLLSHRQGHCEYFATATVLLLRELGIPARYAVGYVVHEPAGKGYVVRGRDAHAWCLVWNAARQTWEDFDTTPASWVAEEAQRATFSEKLADAWSWLKFQFSKFRALHTNLQKYLLIALVPVLALLLYRIIFRRRKRRSGPTTTVAAKMFWPGLDSEFYRLEALLAERGVPRQTGESLADWLTRALTEAALAGHREPLQRLLQLHYRLRFDPAGLTAAERAELARETQAQLKILASLKVK